MIRAKGWVTACLICGCSGAARPPAEPPATKAAPIAQADQADGGPASSMGIEVVPPRGKYNFRNVDPPPSPDWCSGAVGHNLISALSARAASARICYEELLSSEPKAQGALLIDLLLSSDGTVYSAVAVDDSVGSPPFRDCVLNRLRSSTYPAPVAGCAHVRIPLRFVPKKPEDQRADAQAETPAQP